MAKPGGSAETLIAEQYAVDLARPLPDAGAGLPAYAAIDRRGGAAPLMAVQARSGAPLRARMIAALSGTGIEGLCAPVTCGPAPGPDGRMALFVICQAPPGPRLDATRPWSEAVVIDEVLRPVATALDRLQGRHVTHRGIRPNNLFRAVNGGPVTLGAAWAGPPAALQPALFEPPYSACCHPAGRGDGAIADDVYALAVTLIVLALGRNPLHGLDDEAILQRKLELGSHAALLGTERLPPLLGDLVRGMLAEDPDHRPTPILLTQPSVARSRRVATRPPRRAQWPFETGGTEVWNARGLARVIAHDPSQGAQLLRNGAVGNWLRRSLGDAAAATRIEDVVPAHADAAAGGPTGESLAVMRAAAVLDPLAPLFWHGRALWPDGIGPLLVAAAQPGPGGAADAAALEELISTEAAASWAALRAERCDVALVRQEARQNRMWLRLSGLEGGMPRLCYTLNPLLPCSSPLLDGQTVVRLPDLVPALERAAARPEARRLNAVDRDIAAFIAARSDTNLAHELVGLGNGSGEGRMAMARLRLLAQLQDRFRCPPCPTLARWVTEECVAPPNEWRNRTRRRQMHERLDALIAAGWLPALVELVDDAQAREADKAGLRHAEEAVRAIDAELAALATGAGRRTAAARRLGHEIAAGGGLTAVVAAMALLCLA
ncbi:MAG TPA: hypothetical protein VME92_19360 [Acetobacteraceae bacterium]|nr:hypothetical protein [Acetobacteraceae bacterium]